MKTIQGAKIKLFESFATAYLIYNPVFTMKKLKHFLSLKQFKSEVSAVFSSNYQRRGVSLLFG